MALIRWLPFHEMEALQRDMNRMFETMASSDRDSMRQSFMPLAEMEETENAIHLKVEVPGMNAEDLDVQVIKVNIGSNNSQQISSSSQAESNSQDITSQPKNGGYGGRDAWDDSQQTTEQTAVSYYAMRVTN